MAKILTPKEKAEDLVSIYFLLCKNLRDQLNASLVVVNELINSYSQYKGMHDQEFFDSKRKYWEEVKYEIKNFKP